MGRKRVGSLMGADGHLDDIVRFKLIALTGKFFSSSLSKIQISKLGVLIASKKCSCITFSHTKYFCVLESAYNGMYRSVTRSPSGDYVSPMNIR